MRKNSRIGITSQVSPAPDIREKNWGRRHVAIEVAILLILATVSVLSTTGCATKCKRLIAYTRVSPFAYNYQKEEFIKWAEVESKELCDWMPKLSNCDCPLQINPNLAEKGILQPVKPAFMLKRWQNAKVGKVNFPEVLHPGPKSKLKAKYEVRIPAPNGASYGQQCTYDENGRFIKGYDKQGHLIQGDLRPGTADRNSPPPLSFFDKAIYSLLNLNHISEDVTPGITAMYLDKWDLSGPCSRVYSMLRPPPYGWNFKGPRWTDKSQEDFQTEFKNALDECRKKGRDSVWIWQIHWRPTYSPKIEPHSRLSSFSLTLTQQWPKWHWGGGIGYDRNRIGNSDFLDISLSVGIDGASRLLSIGVRGNYSVPLTDLVPCLDSDAERLLIRCHKISNELDIRSNDFSCFSSNPQKKSLLQTCQYKLAEHYLGPSVYFTVFNTFTIEPKWIVPRGNFCDLFDKRNLHIHFTFSPLISLCPF